MAAVTLDSGEIWHLLEFVNDWIMKHRDSEDAAKLTRIVESVAIRTKIAEAKAERKLAHSQLTSSP